jgi:tRNA dimethylallyltransferase
VGPTCSGKSTLGVLLAQKISGEIISADSRQFYRYLNIGTAKPSLKQIKTIKHHLISFLNPGESFNASQFEKRSLEIIEDILIRNKVPMVVGGSGLYIKALIDGISDTPDIDSDLRSQLLEEKNNLGIEHMYKKLNDVDPVSADKMKPQNWKRVIRALEVYYQTGKPIWQHHEEYKRNFDVEFLQYGLDWDRKILYRRIEKRVDEMFSSGLVDEVKNIIMKGYKAELNSLNTVGYKEVIEYLNGKINYDKMIELIKRNTRRFAKRQLTWFRKDNRITWINVKDEKDLEKIAEFISTKFNAAT